MEKTCIQYIKEAAKKLIDSKLQRLGAAQTQAVLHGVMRTIGLESVEEACLFVALFDMTCRNENSNMDDLSRYFECSSLDMLEYAPALKSLESKGYLGRRGRREPNILKQDFVVCDSVMEAVVENRPVQTTPTATEEHRMDKYEFCDRVSDAVEDDDLVTADLIPFVEKLENDNPHLGFVGELKQLVGDILDRTLFYEMCNDNYRYNGSGVSDIGDTLDDIYTNVAQRVTVRKAIVDETHALFRLGYIEFDHREGCVRLSMQGKEFFYGEDAKAFGPSYKCKSIYDYVKKVHRLFHDEEMYNSDDSSELRSANAMHQLLQRLEESNRHLPAVELIGKLVPTECERVLFYSVAKDMLDGESTGLAETVRTIYPNKYRMNILNGFKDEKNPLQQKGLVETETQSSLFGESVELHLTDEGKERLLGEDAALYIDRGVYDKQLLTCDKIVEKQLFFSDGLREQLSLLRNSLDESCYQGLCARLGEKHLPQGIAALFYGAPGTGKTESVMQIAKATGRAVMHVDISATKTCWFGESEKLIKKVFTDYRRLCSKSMVKPILLFNEADAVFSQRKQVGKGSVDQTENAIQNIILEEMERLDGILIATTNLADNLDGAFERRFLFKIRFDRPTQEAKRSIWMDKLPTLSAQDADSLASGYDFSGGQIDNIARKALIQEVVKGEKPTLERLIALCSEERICTKEDRRIGF